MRDNGLFYRSLAGVFGIFILASLWHFGYVWLPGKLSAILFPVNESPWEHVKIFFFPAIIVYAFIYFTKGKKYNNFFFGHSLALLITPAAMLGLFYLYRTLLGVNHYLPLDIAVCFISIFIGTMAAYHITKAKREFKLMNYLAIIIVLLMFTTYAILTYYPPHAPIFKDSITQDYGIEGGNHEHEHNH